MPCSVTVENVSCFEVELTIDSKDLGAACLEAVDAAVLVIFDEIV